MFKKLTSSVSGIFILLFAINIISRALGFFREILFAYFFGTQKEFDVYLIAAVIPTTIGIIILYIGQNYFIPAFNTNKANDRNAVDFLKSNILVFFIIGLVLTTLLFFFTPSIVSIFISNADASYFLLATNIFRILLIVLPINAAISIISAFYQAEMDFISPAISRLFLNVIIIPIIIFSSNDIGIYSISIGVSFGVLFQFLYLFLKLRMKDKWKIKSYILNKNLIAENFTSIIVTIVVIESISQLYSLSDRFFYNSVDSGGIASLNYAYNIYMLPVSIISVSIATIIFSKISEYFSDTSKLNINRYVSEFLRVNFVIFIFATFVLIFFGDVIVKIILERGKFGSSDSISTLKVLKIYSISLLFYSTYALYNKILYSSKLIKQLLLITIIGIILKISLNIIFVKEFKQDGLALSTTISYIFFFLSSNLVIRFKLKIKSQDNYLLISLFYLLNISLAYLSSSIICSVLNLSKSTQSLVMLIIFTIVYIINLLILKDNILFYVKRIKASFQ